MVDGNGNSDTRTAIGRMLRDSVIPKLVEDGPNRAAQSNSIVVQPKTLELSNGEVDEVVRQLLDGEDDAVIAKAEALLAEGHTVTDLVLGFLGAVAERLGEFWVRDLCSFADVTLGMSTMHAILRSKAGLLASEVEAEDEAHAILITPVPGQTHVFGASVVEEFFRAAGWDVTSGIYNSEAECIATVAGEAFDVVGLSVGAERSVDESRRFIEKLRARSRNKGVRILVGGPLLVIDPAAAAQLGADASAPNAPEALKAARLLVRKKEDATP